MRLYLAPQPSLDLIRYLRSTSGDAGLEGAAVRKKALNDAINTQRGIDELDNTAQRWLKHVGRPIQAFVATRSKGTSTKGLVTHVLSEPVPNGVFLDIGHGVCICTPQFTFMQMAPQVDLVDAVGIGMELCGAYSKWRLEPDKMGDPYYFEHTESRQSTYDLPPVLKAKRIDAFIERMAGWRGAVAARAAARWVVNSSASPMETAVYLLLCLPKRLGGYGLPRPTLNPKLIVRNPDGTKERYPDLFWSGANVDVEYNSDETHSGEWSRYRDSKREVELTVANVRVLPLTRPQLMNVDEFDAFARGLQRMLGVRARGNDPRWEYRRAELRRKLLADWR